MAVPVYLLEGCLFLVDHEGTVGEGVPTVSGHLFRAGGAAWRSDVPLSTLQPLPASRLAVLAAALRGWAVAAVAAALAAIEEAEEAMLRPSEEAEEAEEAMLRPSEEGGSA